jgi:hypothetical protein
MSAPVYVPKWLIVGFLAAVGCLAGWMLGAGQLLTANAAPNPASTAPAPRDSGPPVVEGATTAPAQSPGAPGPAPPAAANVASPSPTVPSAGVASTVNSTIRIVPVPGGYLGEAITPNSTIRINPVTSVPNVPVVPPVTGMPPPFLSPVTGMPPSFFPPVTGMPPPFFSPMAGMQPSFFSPVTGMPPPFFSPVTGMPPPFFPPVTGMPPPFFSPMAGMQPSFFPPVTGMHPSFFPPVTPIGAWGPPQPLPPLVSPPLFAANLWNPLPGARSRGVAFSEWESYRSDVAGRNILLTTDDSNFFRDRFGKLNANTGDIDASGLNVIDSTDAIIRGSESADEAPYQTVAAALVDLASEGNGDNGGAPSDDDDDDDDDDDEGGDEDVDEFAPAAEAPEANGDIPPGVAVPAPIGTQSTQGTQPSSPTSPTRSPTQATQPSSPTSPAPSPGAATAAVVPPPNIQTNIPYFYIGGDDDDVAGGESTSGPNAGFDFPYTTWSNNVRPDVATAVHTDEGTTLASGSDAIVIGADGYDDDDNRAVGENIVMTRDDGNVVVGGVGDVNAQIGDAEQGVLVMDVNRTAIQGGGAY